MGNSHLKVVKDPTGTSDLRGIDVSLAYGNRKLNLIEKHSHIVHFRHLTRDIFEVVFERVKVPGQQFLVIANHWPSRRLGKEPSEPIRMAVAENISYLVRDRVPGVDGLGLLTHVGHAYWSPGGSELARITEAEGRDLVATAQACRDAGVPIREISVGSARTARTVAFVEGVTEIRPRHLHLQRCAAEAARRCDRDRLRRAHALHGRGAPRGRAVRDRRWTKAFTSDGGDGQPFPGRGLVVGRPALRLDFMAEEHGVGRVEAGSDMRIGDCLEVVPLHICSCVNMFDAAYGVWDGRVDRQIRVAARGRML